MKKRVVWIAVAGVVLAGVILGLTVFKGNKNGKVTYRTEAVSKGDIEARVRKDVNYIRNWSPGLDIKILLRSLGVILYGKNAY